MRKFIILMGFIIILVSLNAETRYKPYILGAKDNNGLIFVLELLKSNLEQNGFEILGEYSPAGDKDRSGFCMTGCRQPLQWRRPAVRF